jgi:hypothetical protein
MDDLIAEVRAADTTEDAVVLLVARGIDRNWAWHFASIERGDSPGDLLDPI